jgi:uncharacterized protein (DUF2147 family)
MANNSDVNILICFTSIFSFTIYMKYLLTFAFLTCALTIQAQSVLGKWKTIDDETGKPKSVVEIFERGGKVYGRVVKLFRGPNEEQDPICKECDTDDPRYKKKVIGMEIFAGQVSEEYTEGEILDPTNGKVYRCKMWLEGKDLRLRGYVGFFYRTQTWVRFE